MKILAFAATNSSKSINKQLLTYATSLMPEHEIEIIDLNDYELPLFGEDKEVELGKPQLAHDFLNKIAANDAIIISFAEHNGSYSVAYKNIFDWASRIKPKVFQNKIMLMLATSPGPGGAASVLASATASAPYFDGNVIDSLTIPSFHDNFDMDNGRISNEDINSQLLTVLTRLSETKPALKQA